MAVELDDLALAKLANELVMNIRPYQKVFADFGITEDDYCLIEKNEYYRKIKELITQEWNSVHSTGDRTRLQAHAGIEVIMKTIAKRALQATEPLTSVIEGAKFLAKVAGIGDTKIDPRTAADRFVITINLGADVEKYNKSVEINPNDVDLGASHGQIIDAKPQITALELFRIAGQGQGNPWEGVGELPDPG